MCSARWRRLRRRRGERAAAALAHPGAPRRARGRRDRAALRVSRQRHAGRHARERSARLRAPLRRCGRAARSCVFTNNDSGWRRAVALSRAGVPVRAVVDPRTQVPAGACQQLAETGTECLTGHVVTAAHGGKALKSVTDRGLRRCRRARRPAAARELKCDALRSPPVGVPLVHLASQAGGPPVYSTRRSRPSCPASRASTGSPPARSAASSTPMRRPRTARVPARRPQARSASMRRRAALERRPGRTARLRTLQATCCRSSRSPARARPSSTCRTT